MSAPLLTARGLYKAYGERAVLSDVAVALHEGERAGLVGINGSGKSTLARILSGLEAADAGDVAVRRDAQVRYLAQEPAFAGDPSALEAAISGLGAWQGARARHDDLSLRMSAGDADHGALALEQAQAAAEVERLGGWELSHRAEAILAKLGLPDPAARLSTMSGGERRRVALAQVLVSRPALAILDEPTNHLDVETIEWLEQHLMAEREGALLLITHDRYFLDRVVSRTLELDRGALSSYDGGWEEYLTAKAERLALEARTEGNRQNFLRRELEWLRRQPKARTGKQKARIERAHAAQAAAPVARSEQVAKLAVQSTRVGGTILELRGLSLEVAGRRLVEGLDLALTDGERVGIVGSNGCGKTSLLRAILGELPCAAGRVVVGKNTRFAYFDQSRAGLDDDLSVQENVAGDRRRVEIGGREVDVRAWLEGFLFGPDKQRQKVGSLSGGERARVALARMLLLPANVVVLDEPTNDLDVATLGALEEMLVEMNGTALVVTHDRYFLDRVATAILAFEGDGRVVRYAGGYASYRAQRAARGQAAVEATPAAKADVSGPGRAGRRAEAARAGAPRPATLTYAERLELGGLVQRIEDAEARLSEVEAELADPALYATRGEEVPARQAALARARAEVERLLARWEELEGRGA